MYKIFTNCYASKNKTKIQSTSIYTKHISFELYIQTFC